MQGLHWVVVGEGFSRPVRTKLAQEMWAGGVFGSCDAEVETMMGLGFRIGIRQLKSHETCESVELWSFSFGLGFIQQGLPGLRVVSSVGLKVVDVWMI